MDGAARAELSSGIESLVSREDWRLRVLSIVRDQSQNYAKTCHALEKLVREDRISGESATLNKTMKLHNLYENFDKAHDIAQVAKWPKWASRLSQKKFCLSQKCFDDHADPRAQRHYRLRRRAGPYAMYGYEGY